ncbi:protein artichoke [Anoplophora glabripennis]|uniref:protein artichoke n=1 Tax=Anoplophora glabripennis TaxID=217634 RepID=UPI000874CAFC|nr:protein artichoke [Anoplophora glabripennis]
MYVFWSCCILIFILWTQIEKINSQRVCPLQEAILPCRCLVRGEEYQIWCSHSDLSRVLDGLKAVGEYIKDSIDELIIENNLLPSLPGRTFFPLKILRLMLRYNGLERVSSDWLAGLQSTLVEIFIVEPRLRSLPDDSLSQLNALQAVTIQTALLKRLPIFSGMPKLRYLQIESQSLLELSPTNFKNNPSLEKLHITSSPKLTRLEANLFFDLPKLSLLNMSYCGISWMHPRAIRELPLLQELWFVGNKITDAGMVGRAGRDLPQLEIIRLDHNLINRLDEASFVDLPSLKKIYLTSNRITELNHGAFYMVPELRTLDLNKNMLRRVHPESFLQHSGSGLEELYLVENDISHVGDLRSLLDALPRLVFLDIRFNSLEAIPFGALRGHSTLEYINLDYNKLNLIDREAFMAMPALRELRLKNNSLSNILETPFWNLPALKGLDLSGNYFKLLRSSFFANLPLLRRVDLSYNELTVIDSELFLPTPSLEHINISYNLLTTIHPATFRHLLNLYELDVSHNLLLEFVPGLPRGIEYLHLHYNKIGALPVAPSPDLELPVLRMLDLSSNKIQTIPKGALRTMPQLRRLYIGKNLLQSLTGNSLVGLSQLEILHLHGNMIAHIHPDTFKDTRELKELNLNNNRLDILIPEMFKDTPQLKQLDLSKNQLAEILPGTLDKNLELQNVDVSYNILVQLPITFYGLKNLKYFDLTSNRIKNLDPEIIGSLSNLHELKISKNFIQELKQGSFNNLQQLKALHLDNNELEFIESNAVRDLPVLKTIKINRNAIKEIPKMAFYNLPSLQVVELQNNELRSISPDAFSLIPQLLMLNLSSNNLVDLEEAGLSGLKSLEMLDVSNNRITRVASSSLERMEWLVELRMDNNDICEIQGSSFNTMPRLRVISLKNNKMSSFPEEAVERLRGNIAVLDVEGNPLICGCNILWLQAWLHESSQKGPHCLDGTLLREMQLSREECSEKDRISEMLASGCEAEFLTVPGTYTTSQVFSQWMKLKSFKNLTKENGSQKNNIAPSPEESEYFYDDYIDYPYNESMIDNTGPLNEQSKDKTVDLKPVTMKVPITTKSPHYTSGDTPTIYAASKNNTKKFSIPPKVNNSPSTSGFTFFGVPLPNLNLNNLLGTGKGRMEAKVPPPTISAERKTAIVNKLDANTGRSSIGNIPQIQTGFVPVLPSYGGFKPIPDPSLSMRHFSFNNTNNGQPIKTPKNSKNVVTTTSPKNILFEKNNTKLQSTDVADKNQKSSSSSTKMSENVTNIPLLNKLQQVLKLDNRQTINFENDAKLNQNLETVSVQTETTTKNLNENELVIAQETTTDTREETTLAPEIETLAYTTKMIKKSPEKITTTEPVTIITTEEPEIITTSNPRYVATIEVLKNTSSGVFKSVHIDKKHEVIIEKNSRTPLSTLLIPRNNQFKQGGRSTITKVTSPHITNPSLQPTLQTSNVPNPLPHRESKNFYDYFTNPSTERISNDDTNWYFANYNKTNLEPYVARITNTNKAKETFQGVQCLQLVLVMIYIDIIM